jgi:hypothetical protein
MLDVLLLIFSALQSTKMAKDGMAWHHFPKKFDAGPGSITSWSGQSMPRARFRPQPLEAFAMIASIS